MISGIEAPHPIRRITFRSSGDYNIGVSLCGRDGAKALVETFYARLFYFLYPRETGRHVIPIIVETSATLENL